MDFKIAIKTGVVAALSWFVGAWFTKIGGRPPSLLGGLWCVVSAIVIVQEHLGGSYKAAFFRFIGIAIGSMMGGLITQFLGASPLSLGVGVTLTVILCSLLNLKDSYRFASLSVAVVMVSWNLKSDVSPWAFSYYRFEDSVLGIVIAIIVVHILWPAQATITLRKNIAKSLTKLSLLYKLSVSLNSKDPLQQTNDRPLIEELEILLSQNQAYFADAKLELGTKGNNVEAWTFLFEHLQSLFDAILSLRNVYSKNVYELFDQDLVVQLDDLILQTENTFQRLANMLIVQDPIFDTVELSDSLEKLKQELIRFRAVRPTRQFPWPDVQNFFVFFYSLKTVA